MAEIQASATDFVNDSGEILSGSQLDLNVPSMVGAGQKVTLVGHLTIGMQTPDGVYEGTIQVTGRDPKGALLTTSPQVTLVISSYTPTRIYLPIILKHR